MVCWCFDELEPLSQTTNTTSTAAVAISPLRRRLASAPQVRYHVAYEAARRGLFLRLDRSSDQTLQRKRWPRGRAYAAGCLDHSATRCFRGPNPTRLLTQRGLLNRERESLGEKSRQRATGRRSPHENRELSQRGRSSQVVAPLAEKTKRRELSLSALCVNRIVGGNSAN